MREYNHKKIEKKWQDTWAENGLYETEIENAKPKEYLLVEFPYPSGDGLHVGHVRSYTAMDVIARKHRMEGKNVLYPMGWDAFGLPTENFAVKTGIHPKKVTKQNTDNFRTQLQSLGLSFDWSREINTTDPNYYKWTQWIFQQLFKEGLAYKQNMPINWCLDCKIGLANEEVVDGKCERCGGETEKRDKEQWMLEITKYADRLIDDLDEVDYWDRIKTQQKNWIGRSEGAEISFKIQDTSSKKQINSKSQAQNSKQNVVFVRGCTESKGDNHRHWLPWAEKKLIEFGIEAARPEMPAPWNPSYDQWKEELEKLDIGENTTLVGHSCGCAFLVRWLGETKRKINKLVLVAPWKTTPDSEGEKDLYDFEIDPSVKNLAEEIVMFTSDNEEDAGKESLEIYKNALGGKVVELKSHGHFVEGDMGTSEFPELLDEILATNYQLQTTIPVFTTRPDTLFGATYLVLSPEHEEITKMQDTITNWDEVEKYITEARKKTEIERTAEEKEKTGVKLEGVTAINPANNEEIPVFIADYVLAHYGTGAIMAVPAHDERDYAFAQKYELPIKEVIMPTVEDTVNAPRDDKPTKERHNVHAIVYDPKQNAYLALHSKEHDWKTVIIGGIEEGEEVVEAAKREVREETGYTDLKFECALGGPVQAGYFAKHKDENRKSITQALYFTLERDKQVEREDDDGEVIWVSPEDFKQGYMINSELPFWLERLPHKGACVYTGSGVLINSGTFDGMESEEAKKAIVDTVGGEMKTTYKLRDWVFSRQRYWGEPIPLVFCETCKKSVENSEFGIRNSEFNEGELRNPGWVVDENLPVELPEVEDFMPTESGESPLAKATDWLKTICPKCGGEARRETDVMPNWAGSSWYYLRYTDAHNNHAFAGEDALNYWTPVDWYNGGMEHTTLHLLYSRFWHKFLFDQNLVPTKEPYMKRTSHGMILAEGGIKMSKSKGNTINPNEVVENVGADTLRMYEMFMGPFDQAIAWNTDAMVGIRKFLERVWGLQTRISADENTGNVDSAKEIERELHKTIKKVAEDIDQLKFNTAVSQMMILVNTIEKHESLCTTHYALLTKILAPFAPHMAEELWRELGNTDSVHQQSWPAHDPEKIQESEMTIAVQIDGKVRDSFAVSVDTLEEEVKQKAQNRDIVQKWVGDAEIQRVVYVPGKLVNIVKAKK